MDEKERLRLLRESHKVVVKELKAAKESLKKLRNKNAELEKDFQTSRNEVARLSGILEDENVEYY